MTKLLLSTTAICALLLNSATLFADDGARYAYTAAVVDYPYKMPSLRVMNDKNGLLTKMVTDANNLLVLTGKVIACTSSPNSFLTGYSSPQSNFYSPMISQSTHEKGTCYQITDLMAVKDDDSSFTATYSFLSLSSGKSANAKVGFVNMSGRWYLRPAKLF